MLGARVVDHLPRRECGRRLEATVEAHIMTAAHGSRSTGLDAAAEPYVDAMMAASPVGLRLSKECLNMSVDAGSIEA